MISKKDLMKLGKPIRTVIQHPNIWRYQRGGTLFDFLPAIGFFGQDNKLIFSISVNRLYEIGFTEEEINKWLELSS